MKTFMDISMDISGCLLKGAGFMDKIRVLAQGVALDFPVRVNRGGYYYHDVQSK